MSRLLAIRPGGLGDCILSFPALESLRARCRYLEVWTPRAAVPLVWFADRVRAISETGLDLFGLDGVEADSRLIEVLRGFDAIVSWYGTNRPDFREAAAGLRLPVEFHAALPPPSAGIHTCDFFCAQVGAPLGAVPHIAVGNRRSRDFAAIHPFSGSPKKNWPLDRFDRVADALHRPVEWCATGEQSAALGARRPLLAVDDLAQVADWLSSARVYIGNDSGLTHLAAAVGAPVVALFGASDRRLWSPRGERVEIVEAAGIENIDVATVIAAAWRAGGQ